MNVFRGSQAEEAGVTGSSAECAVVAFAPSGTDAG